MQEDEKVAYELTKLNSIYNLVLDEEKLDEILSSNLTLNPYIQSYIKSYVSGIIVEKDKNGKLNTNFNGINELFKNTKHLNKGLQGIVYLSSNKYIIKMELEYLGGLKPNITKEAIIGLKYLNNIRNYIPNFAYTYGYGKIYLNSQKYGNKISDEKEFLVLENVLNSVTLFNFMSDKNIDILDIQKCYVQIFNALNVAEQLYKYIHNDLNYTNIMIRKFNKDIKINIYGDNMKIIGELTTRYVPYIIDYGLNLFNSNVGSKYDLMALYEGAQESKRKDVVNFVDNYWNFININYNILKYFELENDERDPGVSYTKINEYLIKTYNIIINYQHSTKYIKYSLDQFKEMVTK